MQNDPGKEIDEADVGREEGHDLGAAKDPERVDVQIVGEDPEETEQAAAAEKFA